jgi:sugar phosphate isomerase/epimerase
METVLHAADDDELFQQARRIGFAGVEIVLSRQAPERLEQLLRARRDHELAVPSLVLSEHSDLGGIADGDAAAAQQARDDVERAIAWAAELGASAILVPFFGRAEVRDDDDLEHVATAFRPLCELAGQSGVTLCYEGTLPADRIRVLADDVASRAFGCYFDLANVVARGMDTATELRALGALVRRLHFKDTRIAPGDCRPGLGRVDFHESARALEDIGYDGWVVLETPPGTAELVAGDLSFARSVLPRLTAQGDSR